MGRVIYLMNMSLDGFVETPEHSLDWVLIDEELHTWFNDQEPIGLRLAETRTFASGVVYLRHVATGP